MSQEKNLNMDITPHIALFVSDGAYSGAANELSKLVVGPTNLAEFTVGARIRLSSDKEFICHLLRNNEDSLDVVKHVPMGAIVIDNRDDSRSFEVGRGFADSLAGQILPELLVGAADQKGPVRRSILTVLSQNDSTPYHAYAIGTFQLGCVLVEPGSYGEVLEAAHRVSRPSSPGKVALCLAGGGIEGMFYEIGVLRALDALLENASVADFDIFSGISAGAVIGAFLANGVRPYEIANALHGRPSRVKPVTRSMLFDPNVGEVIRRLFSSVGDMLKGRWLTSPIDSAMRVTPTAMFSGDKLREYLQKELAKPGMSDDFETLHKALFVGVTDQDHGVHVSFGTKGYRDVPISTAVRASTAMTPYYNPEKIGDRYFVDGIFTRTIDIDVAVAAGARLIICVDPLTPVQTTEAGFVHGKGGFFNTVQSVKSMIRTRFSEVIDRAEEEHPDVSVFVFSPSAKDMEQMSGTMMRFFYRTETENMAFDSACERIRSDYEWLAADLAKHGYALKRP